MKTRIPQLHYETLSETALNAVINCYIKQEKYDDLLIALGANKGKLPFEALLYAIDQLNPKLVLTLLSTVKNGEEHLNISVDLLVTRVTDVFVIDLWGTKQQNLSEQEVYEKKGIIIKTLLTFKADNICKINKNKENKIEMDQPSIEVLAQYVDDDTFQEFIRKYNISIEDYKKSMIPSLLFNGVSPMADNILPKCTATDILLNRSYISEKEEDRSLVLEAYKSLLSWQETKKIFHFVVENILKGDSLKVLFTEGSSYYNPEKNLVCIQLRSKYGFTIESIMAHEFSHYLMEKLYYNQALPFSVSKLNQLIFKDKFKSNYETKVKLDNLLSEDTIEESKKTLFTSLEYDKASCSMLKLAKKLLRKDIEDTDLSSTKQKDIDLNSTKQYVPYLKECTILPIFYLYFYDKFSEKVRENLDKAINTDAKLQKALTLLISNLLDLPFISEQDNINDLFNDDRKVVLKYLLDDCLPQIVEQYQLLKSDMFFLGRVGDILFRSDTEDRLVEYIVRYPEFAALNQAELLENPKIMESFEGLKNFWEKHIIPEIDGRLENLKTQFTENDIVLNSTEEIEVVGNIVDQVVITDMFM